MNRLLHLGLEVLNAHAETIKAEFAKSLEMRERGYSGVDLDADFTVGIELKMFLCEREEILDLLGREVGGCAAAPMELDYGAILRDATADALHFLLEHVKIGWGDTFVFLDDDVARAEEAEAFAEGNVHVEGDGGAGGFGLGVNFFEIGRAEAVVPNGGRGIAGVTRAGAIVLGEKFLANMKLASHLVQTWMCECHAKGLLPHLGCGPSVLN